MIQIIPNTGFNPVNSATEPPDNSSPKQGLWKQFSQKVSVCYHSAASKLAQTSPQIILGAGIVVGISIAILTKPYSLAFKNKFTTNPTPPKVEPLSKVQQETNFKYATYLARALFADHVPISPSFVDTAIACPPIPSSGLQKKMKGLIKEFLILMEVQTVSNLDRPFYNTLIDVLRMEHSCWENQISKRAAHVIWRDLRDQLVSFFSKNPLESIKKGDPSDRELTAICGTAKREFAGIILSSKMAAQEIFQKLLV